jgi:hypothetical protein
MVRGEDNAVHSQCFVAGCGFVASVVVSLYLGLTPLSNCSSLFCRSHVHHCGHCVHDVFQGDSQYSAAELSRRYGKGGSAADSDLSASQLRARYAIPNNTHAEEGGGNKNMLIAVVVVVILAGAAFFATQ